MELKEKFIKEKCVRNIAGEPIVACASADWIWKFFEPYISIPLDAEAKPACKRKLIISIENDTVLFDNLNDFKPLEFMGILHNAVSTADVLYKTKVMQMVEKASKSV